LGWLTQQIAGFKEIIVTAVVHKKKLEYSQNDGDSQQTKPTTIAIENNKENVNRPQVDQLE
jgi:hypothetical protein